MVQPSPEREREIVRGTLEKQVELASLSLLRELPVTQLSPAPRGTLSLYLTWNSEQIARPSWRTFGGRSS